MGEGDDRDPLERLSEEFLRRKRRGEAVDVESFAADHPEHAAGIRALFPTLLQLEGARSPEPVRAQEQLGRWRILDELGRGGMGVVYLAEDGATGERVALKLRTADQPGAAARFRREAEAVARIDHPGICRVVEVGEEAGRIWIAFEHLEGETLADALRRARRRRDESGPADEPAAPDPARWLEVAEQVARALHTAHGAGLVHRDIKPANVMLTADGRVVVLDFGLAHDDATGERTRLTHTGVPVGTPAYMSPEQVHARPTPLDARTDVYSLGATLYEALTLHPPFEGPTVASLFSQILTIDPEPARIRNPELSRDQALVVATALEKRPERRYATARGFADDLARAREGRRVRARPVGPVRRLGTWAVRHPITASVAAAIGLALTTGLVVALVLLAQVRDARDAEALSARHARARALASASAETRRDDASLSLLLALAGLRAERSPETLSQLHAALHGDLERVRLTGHGGAVTELAWSARGTHLATGCADGRARVFRVDGTLVCTVPPDDEEAVPGEVVVSLSPSASHLVTTDADGRARLWSGGGAYVARLDEPVGRALGASFLDDQTVATVGADGRIAVHDTGGGLRASWRVPVEEGAQGRAVKSVVVSGPPPVLHVLTGDLVAYAYDGRGQLMDVRHRAAGARATRLFEGGRLAFLSNSPENVPEEERRLTLTVLSADGAVVDLQTGGFRGPTVFCGAETWWCAWSRDEGATLVDHVGGRAQTYVLDLQRLAHPDLLRAAPDGSRLLTVRSLQSRRRIGSFATGPVRLWSVRAAPLAAVTTTEALASEAKFSPDGRHVALGWHSGGLVTIHVTAPTELATGVPRWRGEGFRYAPMVTADGHSLAYFHDEGAVRVLSEDGAVRSSFALGLPTGVVARYANLEPHLGLLVSTASDHVSRVHDLDGRTVRRLPFDRPVHKASWLGRDGTIVAQVEGPRVRILDEEAVVRADLAGSLLEPPPHRAFADEVAVATQDGVRVLDPSGNAVRAYGVRSDERPIRYYGSPSGRSVLLLRAGRVRSVCRYYDADGEERWHASFATMGVGVAPVAPDGDRVLLPAPGGISLRDGHGVEIAKLPVPGGLASAAFDAPGARIVTASLLGAVSVWDRDGRRLFDLPAQGGAAMAGFSADGRRVATVTQAMARLYTTSTDELEALASERCTRELTDAERIRYAEILARGR